MGVSTIEWTKRTWNPVAGCSVVSPGCHNCYARTMAARFSAPGAPYHGLAVMTEHGPQWTGEMRLVTGHLADPLKWRKPQLVFVNSMSDLFHEGLNDGEIDQVFAVMNRSHAHTFQVLTKRADRMRRYAVDRQTPLRIAWISTSLVWPLHNVWLGVSVEDQKRADERIPCLLETPAAVRFLSCEPLLGPVDLFAFLKTSLRDESLAALRSPPMPGIDWVIVGSESGPGARPMAIEWARDIVDQCVSAGVPVFVKQIANVRDRKGGNPEFWPPGVWPRQFPTAR
jgi:protein gp37